ncbi:hypothetical protein Pcinc_011030 [Petrolisthes cinctipes]|uniref:Gag-like protein n=1 Tax=Petrolisthes cinctipes TaxID=88211 RepID=A0AAE1G1P7_PETCI|nr:hypothetical protein Pcinc_011030 [Petrolisthes cinctipes]
MITNISNAGPDLSILTASQNDVDKILNIKCVKDLEQQGISPIIPQEVKSRRTIICRKVDSYIFDEGKEDITNQIHSQNNWAEVNELVKFPNRHFSANIMKIEFTDTKMAEKAVNEGLRMKYLTIAKHQIEREMYTYIQTCMKCYQLEDHHTTQCPMDRTYIVCSECSSTEHTWRDCKEETKCCINCQGAHRTLAMKCPARKGAVTAKNKKTSSITYANKAATYQSMIPSANKSIGCNTTVNSMILQAHYNNIVYPGTFQASMTKYYKKNNMPNVLPDENPPSREIIMFVNNMPLENNNNCHPLQEPQGQATVENTPEEAAEAQEPQVQTTEENRREEVEEAAEEQDEEEEQTTESRHYEQNKIENQQMNRDPRLRNKQSEDKNPMNRPSHSPMNRPSHSPMNWNQPSHSSVIPTNQNNHHLSKKKRLTRYRN